MSEESKKKIKSVLGKVLLVVIALGISIAFSDVNFVQKGHDFFMGFLNFAFQQQKEEEPVQTMEPAQTAAPSGAPTETPAETPEETEFPENSENVSSDAGSAETAESVQTTDE